MASLVVGPPVDSLTGHANLVHAFRTGEREDRGQRLFRALHALEDRRQWATGWRTQIDEIGSLALAKVADLGAEPQRLGAGQRGQIAQSRRIESDAVWRHALHEVRLQALLQHAEPGTAAYVGAERAPDAGIEMTPQRKDSTAERRVAAGAVRDGGARRGEPLELGVRCVNVVSQHRVRARQRVPLVDCQIVRRPGKRARHLHHLTWAFVDVRLHAKAFVFSKQRLTDLEHRFGRGQGKAWRHGVEQPAPPVKATNQCRAVAVGVRR